jgi:hypothetical protein
MIRPIVLCVSLTMCSGFGQSSSKYQVGTITDAKTHQEAGGGTTGAAKWCVKCRAAAISRSIWIRCR